MNPNELPTQARIEQYEKQARELVEGHNLGEPESIWRIKNDHPGFRELSDSEVRSTS